PAMPAPATVAEDAVLLDRTKLLADGETRAIHQKWVAAGGADADVDGFRKHLVALKHLTEYQAALVGRGHSDGFVIGGYTILDRIGKGASAGVYRAVHTSGQVVALKVLPGSKAREAKVLSRFEREGRLLTQLDHPNVVRAYRVGQAGNVYFIAMEHLSGDTLDEVLARRKMLPAAEAVRLVWQALHGLGHLHANRIVHRDLKPANLMVVGPDPDTTLTGTLKVLDIGIGRATFDEDSPDTRDLDLTTEGTILGTPDYLAPEQARDARTADVRSDIYSVGCVLFHLIAGRTPFQDSNVVGQMVKHATEPIPRLPGGVPAGLQAVLDGMTAKAPADRYPTPAEAAAALTPFLPAGAPDAAPETLTPDFRDWLESEEGLAMPPDDAKNPGEPPKKPAARPPVPGPKPAPKPASATLPAAPAKPPAPPKQAANKTPSAVHKTPPRSPAAGPPSVEPMIDVELVTLPPPRGREPEPDPDRTLFDLDARDFIMLATGAGGVLVAIVLGVLLASALRPPATEKPAEKEPAKVSETTGK
ncbi:MAG: serine/threonine-protein kinase, partial [Fimbriiglobus sp.]